MTTSLSHHLGVFLVFLVVKPFMVQPRSLNPTLGLSLNFHQNLEGIQKGETEEGLAAVRNYLKAFGYIQNGDFNDSNKLVKADEFDECLESAIKTFQKYYHLYLSGKLDFATIKQMSLPRCGVPDPINHNDSILCGSKYAFVPGNPKWSPSKFNHTYSLQSGVEVEPLEVMGNVSEVAFELWSNVAQFTFEEAPNGTPADLLLEFYRGAHGDGQPFDGPEKILAHAFPPTDGTLHFDADEQWSTDETPQDSKFDLITVAIHEVGPPSWTCT